MTVFVLIVEDEDDFSYELSQIFIEMPQHVSLTFARSRESAFSALDSSFFDLIVLDLKIPTVDGALDAAPEHGNAVFSRTRSVSPGTPIYVLTGSPVENFVQGLLQQAHQVDIWGELKKVSTVGLLRKIQLDAVPEILGPIVEAVDSLSEVELQRLGIGLSQSEDRLVRIFTRQCGGARCIVSRLGGGLSGAMVILLRITNTDGSRIHDAVAKLASPSDIRDEASRFDNIVARLPPSATPRKLATLEFGAGKIAGVFYGLAGGYEASAFDIATRQDGQAKKAIEGIEEAIARWTDGVPESRRSIAEVRRRSVSDRTLEVIRLNHPLDWIDGLEQYQIQTRWTCVHGDLHGSNVLVSSAGEVVLIDYGDVGEGPASLDPITLELSLLFHTQGIARSSWPTLDQARQWGSLDLYLVDCPASEFVRACRDWATRVSAGQREVCAAAYGYLVRQLKYDDTNKELAIALLQGVNACYAAT